MARRPALPAGLYVAGRRVVAVGDASAREPALRAAGAVVDRVAARAWTPDRCAGAFLVLLPASLPEPAARRIAADARRRGVLVYAEDRPDLSDLAMPAVARRGAVAVAVSTDGVAPALAARLRDDLQTQLDAAGGDLDRLVDGFEAARGRTGSAHPPAPRVRWTGEIRVEPDGGDPA
ncbi:MAG: hypothetical protein D6689_02175 [Deltaproteobacteria bacterium]|nr:MAG: hypothetical protein D6689_02175 [Deltaproteobacteria bacterium]